jgi:hypothetical protein
MPFHERQVLCGKHLPIQFKLLVVHERGLRVLHRELFLRVVVAVVVEQCKRRRVRECGEHLPSVYVVLLPDIL